MGDSPKFQLRELLVSTRHTICDWRPDTRRGVSRGVLAGSGALCVLPLPLEMKPFVADETGGCHSAIMRSVRFDWALELS